MNELTMQPPTLGGGEVDPQAALINTLRQIQALQQQPVVPDSPLAALGVALQGFSSGVAGKPNPALEQHTQQRQLELKGLHDQAGVAGSLATLENAKAGREKDAKKFALEMYNSLKNDPDINVRTRAFDFGKQSGFLPRDLDSNLAALKGGKEYESHHDQVLTLVDRGIDPTKDPKFAGMYPMNLYGGLVAAATEAKMTGGSQAVNQMRKKPHDVDSMFKIEYDQLSQKPERSDDDNARLGVLRDLLKMPNGAQTETERYADTLRRRDLKTFGRLMKQDHEYLVDAKNALHVGETTLQWAVQQAEKVNGLVPGTKAHQDKVIEIVAGLQGAKAASVEDRKLDVLMDAKARANLRHPVTMQKPQPGVIDTRRQAVMAGYHDLDDKDLEAIENFGKTRSLVSGLFRMTKSLITAEDPISAGLQGAKLHSGAFFRTNQLATLYNDERKAFHGNTSRELGGERGVLTEGDIKRVDGAFPGFFDTAAIRQGKEELVNMLLDVAGNARQAKAFGRLTPEAEAQAKARFESIIVRLENLDKESKKNQPKGYKPPSASTAPKRKVREFKTLPDGSIQVIEKEVDG